MSLAGLYHKWLKRRPGLLYEFEVIHPDTIMLDESQWRVVCGYIGKSRQRSVKRHDEHIYGSTYGGQIQPPKEWGDTIWRFHEVYHRELVTGWWLGLREFRLIKHGRRGNRPIYNVVHNLDNPQRITKAQKTAQRIARDTARSQGRWVYSYQPPALVSRGAAMGVKKRKDGTAHWYGSAFGESPSRGTS